MRVLLAALLIVSLAACRSQPVPDGSESPAEEVAATEAAEAAPAADGIPAPADPGAAFAGDAEAMALWNQGTVQWHDYESGMALARESGRPAVVVIHASWCPRCTEYAAVFSEDSVVEMSQNFIMIIADKDQNAAASAAFALDGSYVPRTVFLSPDGEPNTELNSGRDDFRYFLNPNSPDQLLELMQQATSG
ncbi:MAG: protein-disulfide reductase (glutathione) [Bradymonadia bacterium]|jgi:protein-disulfide reductase (glutathione)